MTATPGNGAQLKEILTAQGDGPLLDGCRLYLVAADPTDGDVMWVTEVWETPQAHQDSLQDPRVRELISRALPILDREGLNSRELEAVAGVPPRFGHFRGV